MYIQIENEGFEFDNSSKSFTQLFEQINQVLEQRGLNMTGIKIDGQSMENPIHYIDEHYKEIKNIEVVTTNIGELVDEVLMSANQYVTNAIPLISKLSEEFYQLPSDASWKQLGDLFEGMQWIIETLTQIDAIKNLNKIVNSYEIWNEYVQSVSQLSSVIPELEGAIKNKDTILVGDMLSYEIVPIFENMSQKVALLVSEVGKPC